MTNADLVYQNGPWNPTPRDILARRAFIKRTRDGTPNIGNTVIRIPLHSYNTPIIGRLPPSAYATASITHKSLAYGTKKKPQAGRRSLQRLKSKARPEDQPKDDRDDFIERYNREINANVDTLMTDANPTKSLFKSGKKFDVEAVGGVDLTDARKQSVVSNNSDESSNTIKANDPVALADKAQEERGDNDNKSNAKSKKGIVESTFESMTNLFGKTTTETVPEPMEVDTSHLGVTPSSSNDTPVIPKKVVIATKTIDNMVANVDRVQNAPRVSEGYRKKKLNNLEVEYLEAQETYKKYYGDYKDINKK